MNKDQTISELICMHKAGMAITLDTDDQVCTTLYGSCSEIVEAIISMINDNDAPDHEAQKALKTIMFSTTACLLMNNQEDAKTFFSTLNEMLENAGQTKYVQLTPKKS